MKDRIILENVSFDYRGKPVLKDFSASFEKGRITALTGKNGCGKTTLTKLMVGMLRPSAGRVLLMGEDAGKLDLFQIGQRVGYVFQNPNCQLFCQTVWEEASYGLERLGFSKEAIAQKTEDTLRFFRLWEERKSYPLSLSSGQRRRLALAAVLCLGTAFVVLDEPATGLDVWDREQLGQCLEKMKERTGCGVIVVSHERAFIRRFADREMVMP